MLAAFTIVSDGLRELGSGLSCHGDRAPLGPLKLVLDGVIPHWAYSYKNGIYLTLGLEIDTHSPVGDMFSSAIAPLGTLLMATVM